MPNSRKYRLSRDDAEALALSALRYLASDEANWSRFEAITGVDLVSARQLAGEPGFQAGVLEFLLQHEPSLMVFCSHENIPPEHPAEAYYRLTGSPVNCG